MPIFVGKKVASVWRVSVPRKRTLSDKTIVKPKEDTEKGSWGGPEALVAR
jgi:hypothetical protein